MSEKERFMVGAIRRPHEGIRERNVCQYLLASIRHPPLEKVQDICYAGWMLTDDEREKFEIDVDELDILFNVVTSLLSAERDRYRVQMTWNFPATKEGFERYITSWLKEDWTNFSMRHYIRINNNPAIPSSRWVRMKRNPVDAPPAWLEMIFENLDKLSDEQLEEEISYRLFFHYTSCRLYPQGYKRLKNEFLKWALPRVQRMHSKIARVVPPNVWYETLRLMREMAGEKKEEVEATTL